MNDLAPGVLALCADQISPAQSRLGAVGLFFVTDQDTKNGGIGHYLIVYHSGHPLSSLDARTRDPAYFNNLLPDAAAA